MSQGKGKGNKGDRITPLSLAANVDAIINRQQFHSPSNQSHRRSRSPQRSLDAPRLDASEIATSPNEDLPKRPRLENESQGSQSLNMKTQIDPPSQPLKTLLETMVQQNIQTTMLLKALVEKLDKGDDVFHTEPVRTVQFQNGGDPFHSQAQTEAATARAESQPAPKQLVVVGMDDSLIKAIKKQTKNFEQELLKYHNMKQKLEKTAEEVKLMQSDPTKYPTGVKPFNAPVEFQILDIPWDNTKEQNHTIPVVIKQGSTRRQAMQTFHRAFTLFSKQCMLDGLTAKLNGRRLLCQKQIFHDACVDQVNKITEEWNKGLDEDLDESDRYVVDPRILDDTISEAYNIALANVKQKVTAFADKQNKDALKKKKDKEALVQQKPAVLLTNLVSELINKELKKEDVNMEERIQSSGSNPADALISALQKGKGRSKPKSNLGKGKGSRNPKNGKSPGKTGGKSQNDKKKGKGKGKGGKPFRKGKGKGKGKGKDFSKKKKDKGKGKSSKGNKRKENKGTGKGSEKSYRPGSAKKKGKGKGGKPGRWVA
jgi:hypothetical protein